MCGIAGYFGTRDLGPVDLKKMTEAIRHRGPDDEGHLHDAKHGAGLGHRRLSILDTSALGRQPMTYQGSGLWITYNGEIYNFLELREELGERGFDFRTETDTEVVLAAYLCWGEEAFKKFNGMWALGIYDERRGRLLLCRDRYGIKPLYYMELPRGGLVFASELKAFWALGGRIGTAWDMRAVKTAIKYPSDLESSGHTLLKGVRNLLPSHYLTAREDGLKVRRWWNPLEHLPRPVSGLGAQAAQLRDLLADACRLRMRSDVPIGTSLSGGMDSSTVVGVIADLLRRGSTGERVITKGHKSFTHTFTDTDADETEYARAVTKASGIEAVYVSADHETIPLEMDRMVYYLESISQLMPDTWWRIYRTQRASGVIVTLDGHGGDELFTGYNRYIYSAMQGVSMGSWEFWFMLRQLRSIIDSDRQFYTMGTLTRVLRSRPAVFKAKAWFRELFPKKQRAWDYLTHEGQSLKTYPRVNTELPPDWDPTTAQQYQDLHHMVMPLMLKNYDRASMAHGVEVRVPFLDYRLVGFALSLPIESKLREGYTKYVLREAMKGLLPEKVRLRKSKRGFSTPRDYLLTEGMRGWVEDVLSAPSPAAEIIDVKSLRRDFLRGHGSGYFGWDKAYQFWGYLNALRLTALMKLGAEVPPGAAH
jgi:asparagine synthase (glutamine-hydrolysing)